MFRLLLLVFLLVAVLFVMIINAFAPPRCGWLPAPAEQPRSGELVCH